MDTPAVDWRLAALISGVVALVAGGTTRYFHVRNFRLVLGPLRRQQAVDQERSRIARDLHDDLGAAVTHLKLLGELVERDAANPAGTARHGHQISHTSQELARHVDELVWVVSPQKDHLENLISYLADFSQELLSATAIRCRFDFPDDIPDLPLSGHARHRLFLAFKEVLNNVIKHAKATEVRVGLRLVKGVLVLTIEDNGQGFVKPNPSYDIRPSDYGQAPIPERSVRVSSKTSSKRSVLEARNGSGGNGLANIQIRMSEVGGTCHIDSRPGAGTRVEMRVRVI